MTSVADRKQAIRARIERLASHNRQEKRRREQGEPTHNRDGNQVTGYLSRDARGDYRVTDWQGETILEGRCREVGRWPDYQGFTDATFALVFPRGRGRWVIGYALGVGMLFRGELLTSDWEHVTDTDADIAARNLADYWRQIDADDAERDEWENREPAGDDGADY